VRLTFTGFRGFYTKRGSFGSEFFGLEILGQPAEIKPDGTGKPRFNTETVPFKYLRVNGVVGRLRLPLRAGAPECEKE
jgi:hypothetical protein